MPKYKSNEMFTVSVAGPDEYISFYSKSADPRARLLSNFIGGPVTISYGLLAIDSANQVTYATGEHAFQAAKFVVVANKSPRSRHRELTQYADMFEISKGEFPTALDAKRGGKAFRLTSEELELWHQHTLEVQKQICQSKLEQSADLREFLVSSNEKYLLHFERSSGWSEYGGTFLSKDASPFRDGRCWLKGNNKLGCLWMDIRAALLASP